MLQVDGQMYRQRDGWTELNPWDPPAKLGSITDTGVILDQNYAWLSDAALDDLFFQNLVLSKEVNYGVSKDIAQIRDALL